MKDFEVFKKQLLRNPKIKKEYDALEEEFAVIEKIIQMRIKSKLTQKQFAFKLKSKQSSISRFEKGLVNPTINYLSRVAKVFDKKLVVDFR